jgi:hypothetical protein
VEGSGEWAVCYDRPVPEGMPAPHDQEQEQPEPLRDSTGIDCPERYEDHGEDQAWPF